MCSCGTVSLLLAQSTRNYAKGVADFTVRAECTFLVLETVHSKESSNFSVLLMSYEQWIRSTSILGSSDISKFCCNPWLENIPE